MLNAPRLHCHQQQCNRPSASFGQRPSSSRRVRGRPQLPSTVPSPLRLQEAQHERFVAASTSNGAGSTTIENLVIIGSGPAGYTAAIYAARANLKPTVFEGFQNGRGGQLMTTTEVENFPGFPEGVTGPELMDKMRKQAERWGAELYTEDVEDVDLSQSPYRVKTTEREVLCHSIIVATGATAKRLNLPSEQTFWSKGISACAICDGASPLFKNREVAVVGGGDSALEEAVYLTKYATKVHLLVRGERMRASKAMQDRVLSNKNIQVHLSTGIDDAYGDDVLQGLNLVDTANGQRRQLPVSGLFYGIGHTPNSKLVEGQIELDEAGYVKVFHGVSTSKPGVFAAGDLHDHEWRQAITAAGSGCMAALSAERYLTANNLAREFKQQQEPELVSAGHSNGNGRAASVSRPASDTAETFDINNVRHRGQYALRRLYHESDRVLAVLYTSPTCGPCRTLKPIFNSVVDEYKDKIHFIEIDIVDDQEIAEAAGVNGTPTVQFFKAKERLANLPGVKMKKDYRALINEYLTAKVEA